MGLFNRAPSYSTKEEAKKTLEKVRSGRIRIPGDVSAVAKIKEDKKRAMLCCEHLSLLLPVRLCPAGIRHKGFSRPPCLMQAALPEADVYPVDLVPFEHLLDLFRDQLFADVLLSRFHGSHRYRYPIR